jgi:hypothetical protein
MKLDVIREIGMYYSLNRRRGHTTAMLNGAKSDKNILVLLAHNIQRNYIDIPKKQTMTLGEVGHDRLKGLTKPLLIDHYTFQCILQTMFDELSKKDKIIRAKDREIDRLAKLI